MAKVFIPVLLQPLAGGAPQVDVEGTTVREIIAALDARFPGIAGRLVDQDRLRPNLAVAVDGEISTAALRAKVGPESEVHFVAAIKGGGY